MVNWLNKDDKVNEWGERKSVQQMVVEQMDHLTEYNKPQHISHSI